MSRLSSFITRALAALTVLLTANLMAWTDDFWKGGLTSGNWEDVTSWNDGTVFHNDHNIVFGSNCGNPTVTFTAESEINYALWVENADTVNPVVWQATEGHLEYGLAMKKSAWDAEVSLTVGTGAGGSLKILSGTYTTAYAMRVADAQNSTAVFTMEGGTLTIPHEMNAAGGASSIGTVNLNGGVVTVNSVVHTGSATINFNGGTLTAGAAGTLISSGITVTVGANGGTIDTNGKAVTIASAITGTGTLTITGGGVATFTTAPTCGLDVENGVAVLPGNPTDGNGAIEIGAHGALAFDLTNWTIENGRKDTLAWNVTSLTIPNGESYADSIFTIGPDFTSTISYADNCIYATATSDATYTGETANVRYITTTLNGGYMDDVNSWINIEKGPNGAYNDSENNYANPNFQGDAQRRDIVVILGNATVSTWGANRPSNFTYVVRGSDTKLTLNNGDSSTATDLAVANIYNAGTITTENSVGTINLSISNPITTGGTVVISGGAMTFPAGSTFSDISATTVKVTGTVTGTTVAGDGTIGAGTTLFTLTGATPTFANSTVTVSINNTDTAIHYTKGDNGVYTAGKVFYWISNSTANTTSNPDNYVEYDYCWSTTEGGSFVEGERPLYCDTAIFNKSGKSAMTHSDMPYNIKVMSDFYFHSKDKSSNLTNGRTVGVSGLTTFFVANDATAYISVDAGSWYNNTKLVSTVLGGNRSRIVAQGYATNSSIRFNGDMSSYEGVVDIRIADSQRGSIVGIYEGALDSKYTRWYVSTNGVYAYRGDNNAPTMFKSEGTFKMGLLRAYISDSHNGTSSYANKNVVLELGENLDEDSWLRNAWCVQNATYGGKVKWLAKTATFTNAVANAYEVDILGGGNVYVEKDATTAANFVPSVVKFLAYTDSENVVRGGGYLTLDGNNSAIAGNIVNAIAVAGDGETQVATGFNVEAVEGGVSANVTKSAVLNNAVGFKKKGAGTLTLSGAFTKLGMVNVTEGSLVIVATSALAEGTAYTCAADTACTVSGTTYTFGPGVATFNSTAYPTLQSAVDAAVSAGGGTVTLIANVEEDVLIEAAGVSIVLGDYIVTGTVTSSEDYDIVYDENTKTWTSSETANFIWCGGNGTSWSTPANWKKNAVPGETDTVVFPETTAEGGWIVVLDADKTVGSVIANGNVTFSGAKIYTASVSGEGLVTLSGNTGFHGYNYLGATLSIMVNLHVTGDSNWLEMYGANSSGNSGGGNLTFGGALTGNGELSIKGTRSTFAITGDWSDFAGSVTVVPDGIQRNRTYLAGSQASSSNAVWSVTNDNDNRGEAAFVHTSNQTYYFGALNGVVNIRGSYYNNTFEIGARNENCSFGGQIGASSPNNIRKVGTKSLTFTGDHLGSLTLVNGIFVVGGVDSMPSTAIKFTGDSTLVIGDAVATDIDPSSKISVNSGVSFAIATDSPRTFANAIGSGTTGGFTKKGSGTLTLSQPPAYTGTTTVESGALVIGGAFDTSSTAIAPGATLKVLTPSGDTPTVSGGGLYEVAVATEGDYTVYTVVASAEEITVDGAPAKIVVDVDDFASIGITAGMTDEEKSAKLKATAANGLAVWQNYVMNIEGNATQKFAAVVTPTTDATMTVATSFGSTAGRTGAGVTVSYKLMKKSGDGWVQVGNASTTPSFSVDPSTLDSNARLKIQAVFAE